MIEFPLLVAMFRAQQDGLGTLFWLMVGCRAFARATTRSLLPPRWNPEIWKACRKMRLTRARVVRTPNAMRGRRLDQKDVLHCVGCRSRIVATRGAHQGRRRLAWFCSRYCTKMSVQPFSTTTTTTMMNDCRLLPAKFPEEVTLECREAKERAEKSERGLRFGL
jgi:hypothetical protein